MENRGTEGRGERQTETDLKAEVAHEDWPYLRAPWSSAIKGGSQQYHVHPNPALTHGDSGPPLILFLSPISQWCFSLEWLLVFRTLRMHTVV